MFSLKIKILKNLFLGTIISLCILGIDHANRYYHPHLGKVHHDTEILACLIMLTLPFLDKNRNFILISTTIVFIILVQLIYFGYFGVPLSPMDISLFFTHMTESLQAFSSMVQIIYFPLVICGLAIIIIYMTHRTVTGRIRWKYAWILLTLELCAPVPEIIKLLVYHHGVRHNPNKSLGDYPDTGDSLWISSQKTLAYYLIDTLPHQYFSNKQFAQKILPPPQLQTPAPKLNIILVMGESLTSQHLSAYHYSRNTTPYLNSLQKQKNVIFKNGISAGVCTDISLSMLFNGAFRPDADSQIASGNWNLFRLAKANGFETYFISTQGSFFLNIIKTYLLLKFIDHFSDASLFGASYQSNALDENLVDYFKKQDLKKPVFMVLHQRGSHFPYVERYTKKYDVFKSKQDTHQNRQIDTYDNSVLYTDALLANLSQAIIQKTTTPTILIMTSDHGESLGENGIYGHNNLREEAQFHVPIIFIALNGAKLDWLKQKNREDINPEYMSHYELSKVISNLLGYQIDHFSTQREVGYVVNGNSLSGIAGYNEITISVDGKLINHYH